MVSLYSESLFDISDGGAKRAYSQFSNTLIHFSDIHEDYNNLSRIVKFFNLILLNQLILLINTNI